jgi:cytochrome c-type biogenesis protein CcmF
VPFLVLIGAMAAVSIGLVVSRAPSLKSEHRLDSLLSREAIFLLNNLVLVSLCFVVFWGTFFPLISEAVTGNEASVGPPWFDRYIVPLAIVLVLLTGIGPVIAWRRATAANLRRNLGAPALAGVAVCVVLIALGVTSSWPALLMFSLAGFVFGVVVQEFARGVRARRAVARESVPVALVSLVKRNRRRYGGYLVHLGVVTLFVGVAASSTFDHVTEARMSPGQTVKNGGYKFTYVKPIAELHAAPNGRLEKISLGALLRVQKGNGAVRTLRSSKDYFPSQDPSLGPVSRFFDGDTTTDVALDSSLRNDIWTAVAPDTARMTARITEGDKVFTKAAGSVSTADLNQALALALAGLTRSYTQSPPPATFRFEVNPLVTWIWIGGLVVLLGGILAAWPSPRGLTRLASAAYAARVGRDVRSKVPA